MSQDNSKLDLTRNLATLDALTQKVAGVHGHDQPHLLAVREAFSSAARALNAMHLEGALGKELVGTAAGSIARIRTLTNNYAPPDHACRSYRAMLDGLAQLDQEADNVLHS